MNVKWLARWVSHSSCPNCPALRKKRVTGFEPATHCLGSSCATTALHPRTDAVRRHCTAFITKVKPLPKPDKSAFRRWAAPWTCGRACCARRHSLVSVSNISRIGHGDYGLANFAGENLADRGKRSRKQKGHSSEWPQGISSCVVSLTDDTSTTGTTQLRTTSRKHHV